MIETRDANVSTVLLGRFNPLIFTPDWLSAYKIIGPDEALFAQEGGIEVIAPAITSINFGSMKLIVEEPRFTLLVADEPLVRAKDFPVSCFRLLRHTPVNALGLNKNVTWSASDVEKWHKFGDTLAPKEPCGNFLVEDGVTRHGGLRTITVDRTGKEGEGFAHIRVSLGVSESNPLEATLSINHHFNLGSPNKVGSAEDAVELIDRHWEKAMHRSTEIEEQLKEVADGC